MSAQLQDGPQSALIPNLLSFLFESSWTILASIKDRIQQLVHGGTTAAVVDPHLLHSRALQSNRIQMRLLARAGKLEELVQMAEAAKEQETALMALSELVNTNDEQVTALLERLAKGHTYAAVPAVIGLFNSGQSELAGDLFLERVMNGDIARLIRTNRARIFTVLDILGWLDEARGHNLANDLFQAIWPTLESSPQQRLHLLAEILGDSHPDGARFSRESNSVPSAVKLYAIDYLKQCQSTETIRYLWYGTRDENDSVAYQATAAITSRWQALPAGVPANLDPFPMADLNLLFQLCQNSATFEWPDPSGAESVYAQYSALITEFGRLDADNDALQHAYVLEQIKDCEHQIVRITERRINCLQPLVNKITRLLNLPTVSLRASEEEDLAAAYLIGTGSVEINRGVLMEDKPLSEEVMSSVLHELGHMEQDVLVIRMICDDLDLKFGHHSHLMMPLFSHYAEGIGYAPDSMFLLAVMRLRNDEPLTEAQRKRALRLFDAARNTKVGHERIIALRERMARIDDSRESLSNGVFDQQLLTCMHDDRVFTTLFQRGQVPAILVDEVRSCRRELEELLVSIEPPDASRAKPQQQVALSNAMYMSTDYRPLLLPIIERIKAVLLQVLDEERTIMHKELLQIMRAGYHEAEAYEISDRVEVIVKALRKGWLPS